jgi:hypothetical protein
MATTIDSTVDAFLYEYSKYAPQNKMQLLSCLFLGIFLVLSFSTWMFNPQVKKISAWFKSKREKKNKSSS